VLSRVNRFFGNIAASRKRVQAIRDSIDCRLARHLFQALQSPCAKDFLYGSAAQNLASARNGDNLRLSIKARPAKTTRVFLNVKGRNPEHWLGESEDSRDLLRSAREAAEGHLLLVHR